jgi:hypothetical protein
MSVIHVTELSHEIVEIIALGEARELRDVVAAYINQLSGARPLEKIEKMFGRRFRETDRE